MFAMLAAFRPVTETMSPAPMAVRSIRPSPERFHNFVSLPSSSIFPADHAPTSGRQPFRRSAACGAVLQGVDHAHAQGKLR